MPTRARPTIDPRPITRLRSVEFILTLEEDGGFGLADVTEAASPPGLVNDIESPEVVVPGPGVLCVVEEVRGDRLVLFSIADKGAPVDVLEGIEAIAETLPRSINVSLSQQEVPLSLS